MLEWLSTVTGNYSLKKKNQPRKIYRTKFITPKDVLQLEHSISSSLQEYAVIPAKVSCFKTKSVTTSIGLLTVEMP
jgi:hypothetical protein